MARAYYNEKDKFAAQWLRNLISTGHIAPGDVDTRSIEDVRPDDLRGYTQCHFFAGIGVWSYALRLAGWPDDRPVWTGSCPCQPFSEAGKGAGFADERHLWPAWFHLIRIGRPDVIHGEQVANQGGLLWLDLVFDDLQGEGYALGPHDSCSAGVGAPHIRQRLGFVAHADDAERWADRARWHDSDRAAPGRLESAGHTGERGRSCRVGLATMGGRARLGQETEHVVAGSPGEVGFLQRTFWSDCDWIGHRDGKSRPVESGTFPLVDGASSRMGRLRAYGNAINAEDFAERIRDYLQYEAKRVAAFADPNFDLIG